jgi:hypothetical protein
MMMIGMKNNEEITNLTVAKIIGVTVDKTIRAATNENPHIAATKTAAKVPYACRRI